MIPARVGGGQIYKDAYGQSRMLQNDIPPDMVGLCRTDGRTNIGQTYGKTDNITVSRRKESRGKRNETKWHKDDENKLDVAKEKCVSYYCSGMGEGKSRNTVHAVVTC